jgi:hypothetical protein
LPAFVKLRDKRRASSFVAVAAACAAIERRWGCGVLDTQCNKATSPPGMRGRVIDRLLLLLLLLCCVAALSAQKSIAHRAVDDRTRDK